MGETHGATLSIHADGKGVRSGPRAEPVLVLAFECGRPRAGSVRYRLADLSAVQLGRGAERRADREGTELSIKVPDKWMSGKHARIEPSFGRWVLVDTESKNGTIVDGHSTKRSVLTDGSIVELGHTLFFFFERMPIDADAPAIFELVPDAAPPGLATLVPAWQTELARLRQTAASELPILLEGGGGTGKEVLARAIHALSGRKGPFVAVACETVADNLAEARGADRGTLFLDNVGDLPAAAQGALLRMMQAREPQMRVIAAARTDLDERVASQDLRADLFALLASVRVPVPSLLERRGDLGLLLGSLHGTLFAGEHPGFDIDAARVLLRYPWPLNVRELEQALATAQVLAGKDLVRAEHLPDTVRTGRPPGSPRATVLSETDQRLRESVIAAMREHQGNVSAVARALDKDRKQIQRWIKRFGLDPASYR